MTEILTESFCERCGTRYTFESSAPRRSRLGRVRTLSKGVRNFVMSDDASFSEALADARGEEELAATSHQLDAFHKTFNFCLGCRQYTCGNCWNRTDGRCLSCAPSPDQEDLPAAVGAVELLAVPFDDNGHEAAHAPESWPEADLTSARLARVLGGDDLEDEIVVASPAVAAVPAAAHENEAEVEVNVPGTEPGVEPVVVAAVGDVAAESEPVTIADTGAPEVEPQPVTAGFDDAAAAAYATLDDDDLDIVAPAALGLAAAAAIHHEEPAPAIQGMERGQSLEEAVAAYEARLAAEEVVATEPVAVEPEPVAVEPEPVAVEPEPVAVEPEPVAVEPEPVAVEPEPEPIAAQPAARDDVVVQPTWPSASPATTPADVPPPPAAPPAPPAPPAQDRPTAQPWLSVAPDEAAQPGEPQWPAAPVWPVLTTRRDTPMTLAGRPLLPHADASALWAASAREVLGIPTSGTPALDPAPGAPTPQPCVQCGLSLSANARFCRRCGARQG
jgi:hypothetical protein